jgi:predicted nicotinamide N-methyase
MGLAGTAAAALGASVMFADLEAPALMFATLNSLPWRDRVRTRRLNWRNDDLGERFDLIIGADIIYEKAQWQQLVPFWRKHLAAGGVVLLGEPGRQSGELFIEWIANQRWRVRQFEEKVETRQRPIRLIELRVQA